MVKRAEDDEDGELESLRADADDIHIMTGLPYKNTDKFSLDNSAL